jgi:hypothetical protein
MSWRHNVVIAGLALLLAPVAINPYLRRVYGQTLAHWKSKIIAPDRVIIGDSLAAGGGDFGRFGTINLASNGIVTKEVADTLQVAQAYHPRHIIVIAGANDIFLDLDDPAKLAPYWRKILADPAVMVTLIPHTRNPAVNQRIDRLNTMISTFAHQAGRKVITIPNITAPNGLRLPESMSDDIHLSQSAYLQWRHAIDAATG